MKFRGEILALLRLAGVLHLAAMEPEFNPLSPEKKLGTTINTRYRGAGGLCLLVSGIYSWLGGSQDEPGNEMREQESVAMSLISWCSRELGNEDQW